jgi:mono/diheme cytochrome c family protein
MRHRVARGLLAGVIVAAFAAGCANQTGSATDPVVGNVRHGQALFEAHCSMCHGATGLQGGVGPSLRDESRRKDLDATIVWIHHPQAPMPVLYPTPLTADDVVDIASYVQSLP